MSAPGRPQHRRHAVPVLMYHHVSPSPGMINITPGNFERQIAWLAADGWTALSTAQFAGHLRGEPVPDKSVLITFDDGYLNNWLYAHPILLRYGMRAALFVVTGWVHDGPVRQCGQAQADQAGRLTHRECGQRIQAGACDEVIARWSELQAMRQAGSFEIHSHTHTHTRWDRQCAGRQEKAAAIAADLQASRQALVRHLGGVSEHLCWPQGYFDDDYRQAAQAAGFRYLYTTHAFGRNLPGGDPGHIYRFAVRDRDERWLAQRLRLARHPLWAPLYNRFKAWKKGLKPGA
ncbi:polysaccharide deacetylase family protein [Orrella sp. JC864]|uniref:polysaccharide deacetylase family protein n=1 Tax=Orrella sp. JC864 TaxID=3120298 RepID=UPI0012BB8340